MSLRYLTSVDHSPMDNKYVLTRQKTSFTLIKLAYKLLLSSLTHKLSFAKLPWSLVLLT